MKINIDTLETVEPTWDICLRIWWSLFWRSTLMGLGAGLLAGLVGGLLGKFASANPGKVGALFGYVAGTLAGILALRLVLKKEFKNFRILLLKKDPPQPPEEPLRDEDRARLR